MKYLVQYLKKYFKQYIPTVAAEQDNDFANLEYLSWSSQDIHLGFWHVGWAGLPVQKLQTVNEEPSYQGVKEKIGLLVGTQPQLYFSDNLYQNLFLIFNH